MEWFADKNIDQTVAEHVASDGCKDVDDGQGNVTGCEDADAGQDNTTSDEQTDVLEESKEVEKQVKALRNEVARRNGVSWSGLRNMGNSC